MEKIEFWRKTWAFLKRWVGPKTWLYTLGKENLAPKIGTGLAVYQVASIILQGMKSANLPKPGVTLSVEDATMQQVMSLVSMLDITKSETLLWALLIFNVLWVAALIARGTFKFWKIRSAPFFKFGQFGPLFGVAAQFVMGMLVVPLVLTAAIVIIVPEALPESQRWLFWLTAFGFVCVVIAMHYFAFIEKELPNTVNYNIATGNKMQFPVAPKVVEVFEDALNGLTWVGTPEAYSASDDGRVVISLPILYNAEHWSKDEAAQLGARLHNAEAQLANDGCKVLSRVVPSGIERRLPLDKRKPSQTGQSSQSKPSKSKRSAIK